MPFDRCDEHDHFGRLGQNKLRITADTNILIRALTEDHPQQSKRAQLALARADVIALPLPILCELVWVLSKGYRIASEDIAITLRRLIAGASVIVDREAAEAGLSVMADGGDFADGVIAYEGAKLGGDVFCRSTRRRSDV